MKFALASVAVAVALASSASAHTLDTSFERGPGHLPPLSVGERGPVTRPPLPILEARGPWIGSQGRFRSWKLTGAPESLRVAASNTIGPRGGGEVYIYLY